MHLPMLLDLLLLGRFELLPECNSCLFHNNMATNLAGAGGGALVALSSSAGVGSTSVRFDGRACFFALGSSAAGVGSTSRGAGPSASAASFRCMRAKYCSTFFFSRAISVLDEFVWSAGYVSGCAARRSRLGLAGCCCGKATPQASCCESAIAAAS